METNVTEAVTEVVTDPAAETFTETTVPDIVSEAGQVMQAVADGNVDKDILMDFGNALVAYIPTVLAAVAIFIVGKLISKAILKVTDKALGRTRIDPTAQSFLKSMFNIVLSAFVIIIALSALGIPMTSIVTVVGAAGVAIGLALQSSLSNVAGGFIILLTKPFRKGDYIIAGGAEGSVEEITILTTKLVTVDNRVIFVPNGSISSSNVVNFSAEPKRRVDLDFSISYKSDAKAALDIIKQTAAKHEKVLATEPVFARISALGSSEVVITLRIWTMTPNYWDVHFDLIEEVTDALISGGIEIPYNQLDVHIKENVSAK